MGGFEVLADPMRRRLLELIGAGSVTGVAAGQLTELIRAEFGVTQPAVSRQLRVLRESGFVSVRPVGRQRLYTIAGEPFARVDAWLERYRRFWSQRLDALDTEVRRGRRDESTKPSEVEANRRREA